MFVNPVIRKPNTFVDILFGSKRVPMEALRGFLRQAVPLATENKLQSGHWQLRFRSSETGK